ncbi:MAG: hypothetical protein U1E17_06640 [Geminicoccaceae bacterium]
MLEQFSFAAGIIAWPRASASMRRGRGGMSRIAFYAPLKPAEHPAPSGDRRMARSLIALLASLGHEVETACRLRSDCTGDARRQARLAGLGTRLAERLGQRYARRPAQVLPACWFTYHVYHKAPDWLDSPIVRQLGIPYVVAEARSRASRRKDPGRWPWRPAGAPSQQPISLCWR